MSKINYLDFTEYVENNRQNLEQHLSDKGLDILPNKDLSYYVSNIVNLPDASDEQKYIPDPYFVAFDEYYKTDPELKINGGEYDFCAYAAILCLYDTTYLNTPSIYGAYKIVTSDGQEFLRTKSDNSDTSLTITWDKTKDGLTTLFNIPDKLESGQKLRWIRVYWTFVTVDKCYPCYPSDSTNEPSPLVYYLVRKDSKVIPEGNSTGKTTSSINQCKYLKYVTLIPTADYVTLQYLNELPSLEYINNSRELNVTYSYGYFSSLKGSTYPLIMQTSSAESVQYLKKYLVIDDNFKDTALTLYAPELKTVDIKVSLSTLQISHTYSSTIEVLNVSYILNNLDCSYATHLKYLTVPIDFAPKYISLTYTSINKLSVLNLFNNLKDNTDGDVKRISLPSYYFTVLSDEEKLIAINKNWTLSFA